MPLLTEEQVKDDVENRDLIERISSEDLGFAMNFGGPRLTQNLMYTVIQGTTECVLES